MTFDEIRKACVGSSVDDWHLVTGLEPLVGEQGARATYKPDPRLVIAWGLKRQGGGFDEPWTKPFADKHASGHYLDYIFCGELVHREVYVAVDGGRVDIPLPAEQGIAPSREDRGYTITPEQYGFYKTFNALQTSYDFDDYLKRAGIEVFRGSEGG